MDDPTNDERLLRRAEIRGELIVLLVELRVVAQDMEVALAVQDVHRIVELGPR